MKNEDKRFKAVKDASIIGICVNIFLAIIKMCIGIFTYSYSMISDGINSLGDIVTSLISFIGNEIASKETDDDHNLGHGKAEYIFSLLISLVIFFVSALVFKNCILSFFNNSKYHYSIWLIIVCIITIISKFSIYMYTKMLYKKYNNILLKANMKDHISDCIVTFFNLMACMLSNFNVLYFDSIVGSAIAIWIMYQSFELFKESYDVLMDKAINEHTKKQVLEIINSHKEIKDLSDFVSIPIGYKYEISFSIFVDGNLSTFDSHIIADSLEKEIIDKIEDVYLVLIHVNPV